MFEQILSSSTISNNLENSEENTLYVYIGAFREQVLVLGILRYPGRGGKENRESLEQGRHHLRGKNKLRLNRLV